MRARGNTAMRTMLRSYPTKPMPKPKVTTPVLQNELEFTGTDSENERLDIFLRCTNCKAKFYRQTAPKECCWCGAGRVPGGVH
jgi:hypothetical protein